MRGLFGVLDRYVLARLLGVWGVCILGFLLLFLIVDVTSRIDEFSAAAPSLEAAGRSVTATVIRYYATKLPTIAAIVGPYLTLFAGIATLLSLARQNEYVPMIMIGRSVHRVLLPVYVFAVATVLLFAAAEEYVVPAAARENAILDRLIEKKGKAELKKIPHLTDRGNVFSIGRWDPERQVLLDVTCLAFRDPMGRLPAGVLEAAELSWRRHNGVVGWYPTGGSLVPTSLDADGRVVPPSKLPRDVPIAFSYSPGAIDVFAAGSEPGISRQDLLALRRIHPRQHSLTVDLHGRITRPLSSLVLLLLGIPFVAGPEKRSIAHGLGVALLCCIAYFFADVIFRQLGSRGDLNAVVAAWTPTLLFSALGITLFDGVTT